MTEDNIERDEYFYPSPTKPHEDNVKTESKIPWFEIIMTVIVIAVFSVMVSLWVLFEDHAELNDVQLRNGFPVQGNSEPIYAGLHPGDFIYEEVDEQGRATRAAGCILHIAAYPNEGDFGFLIPLTLGGTDTDQNRIKLSDTAMFGTYEHGGMKYIVDQVARYLYNHPEESIYWDASAEYVGESTMPSTVTLNIVSSDGEYDRQVIIYNEVS